MEPKEHIIEILKRTFNVIDAVYLCNNESSGKTDFKKAGSRLIFPRYSQKYREGKRRISEQELRFIFVEQFNKYCNDKEWPALYSVETPTEEKYKFSGEVQPRAITEDEKGGQSAMIDTTIHDEKGNRLCFIEFKANNPEAFCYQKDFVKLNVETGMGFFVQILENENKGTMPNIMDKIENFTGNSHFICHVLNGNTYYKARPDLNIDGWEKK